LRAPIYDSTRNASSIQCPQRAKSSVFQSCCWTRARTLTHSAAAFDSLTTGTSTADSDGTRRLNQPKEEEEGPKWANEKRPGGGCWRATGERPLTGAVRRRLERRLLRPTCDRIFQPFFVSNYIDILWRINIRRKIPPCADRLDSTRDFRLLRSRLTSHSQRSCAHRETTYCL
jgi:hypothetical protein